MIFADLVKKNKNFSGNTFRRLYESEITQLIRRKYSLDEELAILRQRDSNPNKFAEYNDYAEQCKAQVKHILEE
jgi:hypothetical protein